MDYKLSPVNRMVVKAARDFCEREVNRMDDYMKKNGGYPHDLLKIFAKAKMLGLTVPKEYGGVGSTNLNTALIVEELGKMATTCYLPMGMNNSAPETIYHAGTEELKRMCILGMCDGSSWATTAFTEPGTGSDGRVLSTTAVLDGDYYVLSGTKRFISMGDKPGYGIFYARDASLQGERKGVTAFVVDKSSPGYSTSAHYEMMGFDHADTCDVFLKEVRVPRSHVLGKPGEGMGILLRWIAGERVQHMAYTVGLGQAAVEQSVEYCRKRMVGGRPMGEMQGFTWMLAEMKTRVEACRLMTWRAACMQDDGEPIEVVSSELKLFTVPTIQEVARMGLQAHGSYGFSKEYKIEKIYRYAAAAGVMASSTEINKTIAGRTVLKG